MKETPEWSKNENHRKTRVEYLVENLSENNNEKRHNYYVELRDVFSRKRDIDGMLAKLDHIDSQETEQYLQKVISYITQRRWRLPSKGWTNSFAECLTDYMQEFEGLGFVADISEYDHQNKKIITHLDVSDLHDVVDGNNTAKAVELILVLEPESLLLSGRCWNDISFLSLLPHLEELTISYTSVNNLSYIRQLRKLRKLNISGSKVNDLNLIKDLPNLEYLYIDGVIHKSPDI